MSDTYYTLVQDASSKFVGIKTSDSLTIFDPLHKVIVSRFTLLSDTRNRVAFDSSYDRVVIGSWARGVLCFELTSEMLLWKSSISYFTHIGVIPSCGRLYLDEFKDCNPTALLDINTGEVLEKLEKSIAFYTGKDVWIGHDKVEERLLFYDSSWNVISSAGFSRRLVWCVGSNPQNIVVCGEHYVGVFNPSVTSPIKELYTSTFDIRQLIWSGVRKQFIGVVYPDNCIETKLVAVDENLNIVEEIFRFDNLSEGVFIDSNLFINKYGKTVDYVKRELVENIHFQMLVEDSNL